MNRAGGIPLVVLATALIVLGIAWGASSQHETVQGQQGREQQEAAGNLVPLTAFLVGLGACLATVGIGRAGWRRRSLAALQTGVCAWILVALVQGDVPNYETVEGSGFANLGQGTLLGAGDGAATVLLPVVVAGLVLIWGIVDGLRRAMEMRRRPRNLAQLQQPLLASAATGIPILAITIAGTMQVMLGLPGTADGAALAYVLLPLSALAALGWIVILFLRIWHLHGVLGDARLAPFTREVWHILGRVELAAVGVLAAAAIASTALPTTDTDATAVGRTLILTLRSHGQGLIFAIVPLIPAYQVARRIHARLLLEDDATGRDGRATLGFTIAAGVSILGCFAAAFAGGALTPWIFATLPLAIYAGIHVEPRLAVPLMTLAAWVLWARGNAFAALYDATKFPTLAFDVHPGLLALSRIAGAALAAWAAYRWFAATAPRERRVVVIPLALVAAIGLALVAVLEMPLWIWDEGRVPVNKIAIGSLLRSQATGVQAAAHVLSSLAALGGAFAAARLVRPDWFTRKARAVTVPAGQPA